MLNTKEKKLLSKLFGQSVQKIREDKKLLRMDLANRMHVQHTRVAQLEGGKIDPRISTVLAVADALGVTPGELLDGIAGEWRAARRKESEGDAARLPKVCDSWTSFQFPDTFPSWKKKSGKAFSGSNFMRNLKMLVLFVVVAESLVRLCENGENGIRTKALMA